MTLFHNDIPGMSLAKCKCFFLKKREKLTFLYPNIIAYFMVGVTLEQITESIGIITEIFRVTLSLGNLAFTLHLGYF